MISTVDPSRPTGSRRHRVATTVLALVVAGVVLAPSRSSCEPPQPPPFYAITGARVVTGTGAVLENATVLVADGLIEAVGQVKIPADAWRIDGAGLTVYPGLIDSLTTLGQVAAAEEGDGPGAGRSGGPRSEPRGPEDRPRTTPWEQASEALGDDPRIEKWRSAGFTAALTSPTEGIFAGNATLIHLGLAEPRHRVLESAVAQRLNLSDKDGSRSYPSSLMGIIAYVKQVVLDARHAAAEEAMYRKDPNGKQRPLYDRTLTPISRTLEGNRPFLFPASQAKELDRALALADELQIDLLVYGGHGSYARLAELGKAKARVLVDLDWPEAEKDRDPDADTTFRDLYHRRLAPTSPARLAAAAVPFAFYSDDLAGPSEIFAKVRAAIAAGLAPEDALAALTSSAAKILGVGDRLGTIEAGKIANLVVASAEPWAEDVEIAAVFVDGVKYQQPPEEERDPPAADVSGTWELNLQSPRGARELTAEFEMADDGKVSGEITSSQGTHGVEDGRMSGDLLRFTVTRTMGGRTMEASYSLTIAGEAASGSVTAGPMTMNITGERTATKPEDEPAPGETNGDAEVEVAELEQVMAAYYGPARSALESFAIVNVAVYTVTGDTFEDGVVVVENGTIVAVGDAASVALPAGAEIIDGNGGSLIPGIIDAHSHIAIEGGVNEGSLAVTSMVAISDVIDPDDIGIYRALAGGVTSANLLHGSANPIGGQNAVIKLRWGSNAESMKFAGAPAGIKFALGENPKRSNFRAPGGSQRYPQSRMGVIDVIRQAFTEARAYRDEWAAYEKRAPTAATSGRRGKLGPPAEPGLLPPRRDLRLEPLVEILEGQRLVHSHCYRADEILQLIRLADEQGFRIGTLQHVLEGYKVADEIAAHGAGASTFSDWWGYKAEAFDAIPHNAALMTERGVVVSINSDSGEEMRHLNQEAAKAMKWGGLDENAALRLVTLNPAIQLGIDSAVGSIEVGKDADFVLYDGHPLAIGSVVQKTFVDGVLYFDIEADRERQAKVEAIKDRLLPKKDEKEEQVDADGDSGDTEVDEVGGEEVEPQKPPSESATDPPPPTQPTTFLTEEETHS